MNCSEIPPQAWARAFTTLVFYFSRRQGAEHAADLAQQTLLAVWQRTDYQFEKEEDFQRVCYGFASRIGKAANRQAARLAMVPLDSCTSEPESPADGPKAAEAALFLEEVRREGAQLEESEWKLIQEAAAAQLSGETYNFPPEKANTLRVALHRARKKLAKITGWRG